MQNDTIEDTWQSFRGLMVKMLADPLKDADPLAVARLAFYAGCHSTLGVVTANIAEGSDASFKKMLAHRMIESVQWNDATMRSEFPT